MVYISQKFGHAVTGFITAIDYASGVMYVGGTWPDASNPVPTGTRVIINDPVGRFGRVYNAWRLMTADTDNPSIRAATVSIYVHARDSGMWEGLLVIIFVI
jgi:hypothetical protein